MRKRTLVTVLCFVLFCICLFILDAVYELAQGSTVFKPRKVGAVLSASEIIMKDGEHITLAGIQVPMEMAAAAKARVEEVVLPSLVITAPPKATSCVVYVYDVIDDRRFGEVECGESSGFPCIKIGFMRYVEGAGQSVNALLVKEGYATVTSNLPLSSAWLNAYLNLEKLAKKEKRGIWSPKAGTEGQGFR